MRESTIIRRWQCSYLAFSVIHFMETGGHVVQLDARHSRHSDSTGHAYCWRKRKNLSVFHAYAYRIAAFYTFFPTRSTRILSRVNSFTQQQRACILRSVCMFDNKIMWSLGQNTSELLALGECRTTKTKNCMIRHFHVKLSWLNILPMFWLKAVQSLFQQLQAMKL